MSLPVLLHLNIGGFIKEFMGTRDDVQRGYVEVAVPQPLLLGSIFDRDAKPLRLYMYKIMFHLDRYIQEESKAYFCYRPED